jgi:hypothetical protein
MTELTTRLIERWREDPGGTYQSWFLWDERLKNFRSIRRGVDVIIDEIEKGTFGDVYKGSSLETVVHAIAEQRQIFKGLWGARQEPRRDCAVRAGPEADRVDRTGPLLSRNRRRRRREGRDAHGLIRTRWIECSQRIA